MSLLLLCVLALLMALDLRLTLIGLRRGLQELNVEAELLIKRFGQVPGLPLYSAAWFSAYVTVAIAFPSQWAVMVFGCIAYSLAVAGNVRALRLMEVR
jgi:hypothetical protein